jgi:glycine cleavage system aminomethyltransferase T
MAMGYVPTEHAAPDTTLQIEINGELYTASILPGAAYDPTGARMRA